MHYSDDNHLMYERNYLNICSPSIVLPPVELINDSRVPSHYQHAFLIQLSGCTGHRHIALITLAMNSELRSIGIRLFQITKKLAMRRLSWQRLRMAWICINMETTIGHFLKAR